MLLAEVPSWVRSSEVEKAAWLSNGVRSMWPFLDKAISADVVSAVNPILESIVKDIPILNKLALRKTFTLGPVAPHITGVKVCHVVHGDPPQKDNNSNNGAPHFQHNST